MPKTLIIIEEEDENDELLRVRIPDVNIPKALVAIIQALDALPVEKKPRSDKGVPKGPRKPAVPASNGGDGR